MGLGARLLSLWGYDFAPLLGGVRRDHRKLLSIFLNRLYSQERPRATLCLRQGYRLILHPCVAGEPSTPCNGFAPGPIFSVHASQLEHCWIMQLPGFLTNPSGQIGPRVNLQSRVSGSSPTWTWVIQSLGPAKLFV